MLKSKLSSISVLLFLFLWQTLGDLKLVDVDLFPTPLAILKDTLSQLAQASMWQNISISLLRVLVGFIAGWIFGVILAILAGSVLPIRRILTPFINFGYPLPKVALLPLVLVIFGIGEMSKIVLISIGVFFLVYIAVLNGLLLLRQQLILDVAKVYGVRGKKYWFSVLLRGLIPDILTGSKAAFGYALVLTIVSEAQMTRQGLGYFIWQAWEQYRIIELYDALLILGVIGMIAGSLFDRATDRLVRRYSS